MDLSTVYDFLLVFYNNFVPKRAGVPYKQLLHFYTVVIRPVPKYAAPAWHHLINRTQAQHLESVQKRAIHIIFNFTHGISYPNVLFVAQLESLETRRNNLSRSFFSRCLQTNLLSSSSHSTSQRYLL